VQRVVESRPAENGRRGSMNNRLSKGGV
jgi:hypothetical protein